MFGVFSNQGLEKNNPKRTTLENLLLLVRYWEVTQLRRFILMSERKQNIRNTTD